MEKIEIKLGRWMAYVSAISAILWFITFSMQDLIHPLPEWQDLETYAEAFHMSRLTYIYPSLLLAVTYIVFLVCLHRMVPENKKVWTLSALSIGIIYAVMASVNYNIQAVAVRLSIAAGETDGIGMFIPDNPNSVFNALANSYIYMAISMFFAGFAFRKGRLESWIRTLLLLQLITAGGQLVYSMYGMNEIIFIITSMIWVIGAPVSFILMGRWMKQQQAAA